MNRLIKQKLQRKARIRAKVRSISTLPRLTVFRSNNYIYAQIIDDTKHQTLLGASEPKETKGTKTDRAKLVGQELAKMALEKKITKVVFDKGSYAYHGRVKALAEGAREGGLQL